MTPTEKLLKLAESCAWQDISSAPKDGTKIDIKGVSGERIPNAWFSEKWNCWVYEARTEHGGGKVISVHYKVTHWMPLPTGSAGEVIRVLVEGLRQCSTEFNYVDGKKLKSLGAIAAERTLQRAAEAGSK